MFKKGLIHGLFIILTWVALVFLGYGTDIYKHPLGLLIGFCFFVPLGIVGYRYKSKIGVSPLTSMISGNKELFLYPLGIAVYTSAGSIAMSEQSILIALLLAPLSLIAHALSFATNIWIGSWFKR